MKNTKYEIKEISIKSMNGKSSEHYNIMNKQTREKICTCYKLENAQLCLHALEEFQLTSETV